MRERSGGGLVRRGPDPRRTGLRDDERIGARDLGRAGHRPEIAFIRDVIEHDDEARGTLADLSSTCSRDV
jgi:hypothetical protein